MALGHFETNIVFCICDATAFIFCILNIFPNAYSYVLEVNFLWKVNSYTNYMAPEDLQPKQVIRPWDKICKEYLFITNTYIFFNTQHLIHISTSVLITRKWRPKWMQFSFSYKASILQNEITFWLVAFTSQKHRCSVLNQFCINVAYWNCSN